VASDSSGNGNTGTVNGATWAAGRIGNALDFDGTDDYVEIADNDLLDLVGSDLTFAAWINPRTMGQSTQGRIIDHGGGNLPAGGWTFQLHGSPDAGVVNALTFQGVGTAIATSASNSVNLGTWQHVAMTLSSGTITYYIGGVQSGTPTFVGSIMAGTDPVWNAHQTYRWYEADEGWFHYTQLNRFHRDWINQLPDAPARLIRLDNARRFFRVDGGSR